MGWYQRRVHGIIKFISSIRLFSGIILLSLSITTNLLANSAIQLEEHIIEWELISLGSTTINVIFIFDFISLYFISLVRLVAGRVILFRTSYISKEVYFRRFIGLVVSFVISIFLLILRPNIIRLLLGWDGLGVTSYLLVIFYQRSKSYNAGIITALTNRIGDVGLLVSLAMILSYGHWTYIYDTSTSKNMSYLLLIIIIRSACTKRAQIPFSAWLPAAIAAPTPVSALVHSSTLVTAGVYLLIRMNIFLINTNRSNVLIILGTVTIMIAGLAAIFEIDMKKIIALSTLRQLGIMMIILGAGNPLLAYFHLISHAFFKAILFICAGIIIHNIKDYQDIRNMGSGLMSLPITISIMMVANLRLCGLPFLSGFYSKDIILEIIIIKGLRLLIMSIILLSTFLTVAYSCRIRFLVAVNLINSESFFSIVDGDKIILTGIFILLPFSIMGGIILSWTIFSVNKLIFLPFWIKSSILVCIASAIFIIYIYYINSISLSKNIFIWFLSNIWFMPLTFSLTAASNFLIVSKTFTKIVEISWSELILFKKFLGMFELKLTRNYRDFFSYIYIIQAIEIAFLVFVLLLLV